MCIKPFIIYFLFHMVYRNYMKNTNWQDPFIWESKPNTVFSPQNWSQNDANDCSFMHGCFWHCVCSCVGIINPLLLPFFQCHDDYRCIPDCIFIGLVNLSLLWRVIIILVVIYLFQCLCGLCILKPLWF